MKLDVVDVQEEVCIRIVVREWVEVAESLVIAVSLNEFGEDGNKLSLGKVMF